MKRSYLFKFNNKETKKERQIKMFLTQSEEEAFVTVFKTMKELDLIKKSGSIKIEKYTGEL